MNVVSHAMLDAAWLRAVELGDARRHQFGVIEVEWLFPQLEDDQFTDEEWNLVWSAVRRKGKPHVYPNPDDRKESP